MPLRCLTHPDLLSYGQAVYKIEFYVESASHSVLWNAKVARNGPLPLCVCIVDVVTTCILIAARSVSRQNALYLKILWDEYCTFVSITNIYHHSAAGIPPHVILIDFFSLERAAGNRHGGRYTQVTSACIWKRLSRLSMVDDCAQNASMDQHNRMQFICCMRGFVWKRERESAHTAQGLSSRCAANHTRSRTAMILAES